MAHQSGAQGLTPPAAARSSTLLPPNPDRGPMKRLLSGAALLALAPTLLVGCANGQLTPQAQSQIQTALDEICPTATALQPSVVATFNGNVKTVYNAVLLACPPNPPPTNPI